LGHITSRYFGRMNPRKTTSAVRLVVAHGLSSILPVYIVNEFPKSGGTWISKMVAAALDVPFRDNQMPHLEKCVMKGHFFRKGGLSNLTTVWRDGRDVMVSYYHHSYFKFDDYPFNHSYVDTMRRLYPFDDYHDVKANLPKFIEQQFTRPLSPKDTWAAFVERWWEHPSSVHVRYEDMRANPVSELQRIVSSLTNEPLEEDRAAEVVEAFSLKRMKQKPSSNGTGGGGSFVRKGEVGGWINSFSEEASELFETFAGDALDRAGYPRDARLK
jgi:Sulfotransferase domain